MRVAREIFQGITKANICTHNKIRTYTRTKCHVSAFITGTAKFTNMRRNISSVNDGICNMADQVNRVFVQLFVQANNNNHQRSAILTCGYLSMLGLKLIDGDKLGTGNHGFCTIICIS